MSAKQKLSDEQINGIRDIVARRRAAVEVLRRFPTNAQLAKQFGCTERYVDRIANNHVRRETQRAPNIEALARDLNSEHAGGMSESHRYS